MPTTHLAQVLTQSAPRADQYRLIEDIKKDNAVLTALAEKEDKIDEDYICSQESYGSSQESCYSSQESHSYFDSSNSSSSQDSALNSTVSREHSYQERTEGSDYHDALEIAKNHCKTTADRNLIAGLFADMYQVKKQIVYLGLL